jgi:hypothetical protein
MIQVSRRDVLRGGIAALAGVLSPVTGRAEETLAAPTQPLEEFDYEQIEVRGARQVAQRENVTSVLMDLDEDSLLKPFRAMAGKPAPGVSLGGWYEWKPDYDHHHDDAGLAPGSTFGQWTSAMARLHAASKFGGGGNGALADRAVRLNRMLAEAIGPKYFAQTRFPGYSFDKLVCGLMDSHRLLADGAAFAQLNAVTDAAVPSLPGHAVDREVQWKVGADLSWMWDETYTLPENLYLAVAQGAGPRYRQMAEAYLNDATYFGPLSRGVNVLGDKHAYSYVNSLCSAMQAYLTGGSRMHLEAAKNGFSMLEQQSFATGGWGPDELLRKSGYGELTKSLTASHNGFETPCGSYAHMKLTRYLLRATRDGRYGDSMERVLHNTVMGALPLQADGRSFYSSDYNFAAKRIYSVHRWPCCSGTLPQVVADYGINSYLREPGGVWVNLYQLSELRWKEGTGSFALEQTSGYPLDGSVRMRFTGSRPLAFALRLRIPAWSQDGTKLRVNGRPLPVEVRQGFASLDRTWKSGETVELDLPMSLRLEPLPDDGGPPHPEAVALLRGPLVLFAIRESGDVGPLRASREALLRAEQTGPSEWTAQTANGARRMVPFIDVGDREYSTYLVLS